MDELIKSLVDDVAALKNQVQALETTVAHYADLDDRISTLTSDAYVQALAKRIVTYAQTPPPTIAVKVERLDHVSQFEDDDTRLLALVSDFVDGVPVPLLFKKNGEVAEKLTSVRADLVALIAQEMQPHDDVHLGTAFSVQLLTQGAITHDPVTK